LKPTEPMRWAGRGRCLRPSHKFSDFLKTFSLGVTFLILYKFHSRGPSTLQI
jgi:hypothetical protein